MLFRNLRLYKLSSDWPESEQDLSDELANGEFTPCGSLSERSLGWEPPAAELPEMFARRVAGADLMRLRHQVRVLPAAAIKEALEDRLKDFEERMGQPATAREKRELKEEVTTKLLPQALPKSSRISGFYIAKEKLLGIDTASDSEAERFLDQLRAALGSLAAVPLAFSRPTGELLYSIFLGTGPEEFRIGRECRMQDPDTPGSSVNWLQMDLADASVRKHVREGLNIERLGIEFDNSLSLTLDSNNVLRKLKLLGLDSEDDIPEESELAKLDADFALTVGAVRRFVRALKKALSTG